MRFDGRKNDELKKKYPIGSVVEIQYMDDPQGVPKGTKGVIAFVDDAGQIHVNWDNGSGLALIPGVDEFSINYDDVRNAEVLVDENSLVTELISLDSMLCFISYTIKDRLNRHNQSPNPVLTSGIFLYECTPGLGRREIVEFGKSAIEADVEKLMINPKVAHMPQWFQYLYSCLIDSENNMAFSSDYGMDTFLSDIGYQVEEFLNKHNLISSGCVELGVDSYLTIYPSILNHFSTIDWDTSKIDISFLPVDQLER